MSWPNPSMNNEADETVRYISASYAAASLAMAVVSERKAVQAKHHFVGNTETHPGVWVAFQAAESARIYPPTSYLIDVMNYRIVHNLSTLAANA